MLAVWASHGTAWDHRVAPVPSPNHIASHLPPSSNHIAAHHIASHIFPCLVAWHRMASYRTAFHPIASRLILSHRITYCAYRKHRIAFAHDLRNMNNFVVAYFYLFIYVLLITCSSARHGGGGQVRTRVRPPCSLRGGRKAHHVQPLHEGELVATPGGTDRS